MKNFPYDNVVGGSTKGANKDAQRESVGKRGAGRSACERHTSDMGREKKGGGGKGGKKGY